MTAPPQATSATAAPSIDELREAYAVLGVAHTATAHVIKSTHHKMIQRWQVCAQSEVDTAAQDAPAMMRLIDEAYAKIQHAPLRYYVESYPKSAAHRETWKDSRASGTDPSMIQHDTVPLSDWREFVLRFALGVFIGLCLAWRLAMEIYRIDSRSSSYAQPFRYPDAVLHWAHILNTNPEAAKLAGFVFVVGCGFLSALLGDWFWTYIIGQAARHAARRDPI